MNAAASCRAFSSSRGAGWLLCFAFIFLATPSRAAGKHFTVHRQPSQKPGELQLAVDFSLWLPDNIKRVRAIIVHQHGCGPAANAAGETAAHDLHWQALARKWDAALLSPRYHQTGQGREGCELWMDPRQGSRQAFLDALDDFSKQSGHAEISTAPWCLWGHSGGGFWSSLMQTLDPQRIVAVWLRSGTAFPRWENGEIEKPALTEGVYRIPTMLNPGIRESGDERPIAAWLGSVAMFKAYRAKDAPIAFAADPLSGHDCGGSRYLAIPYFDACLALRLPGSGGELRPIDLKQGWLAELMGRKARPYAEHKTKRNAAVWLPGEHVAGLWMQYVASGTVTDSSPPPAPTRVKTQTRNDGGTLIEWDAVADFESGLAGFIIERDGAEIARLPEKPVSTYAAVLFQPLSFHDTPEPPLPEMRYIDTTARAGAKPVYRITALNTAGLKSEPAPP